MHVSKLTVALNSHIGCVERQAQERVCHEGENSGDGGDDAGDAGVGVLDVDGVPQFFLLIVPQLCRTTVSDLMRTVSFLLRPAITSQLFGLTSYLRSSPQTSPPRRTS